MISYHKHVKLHLAAQVIIHSSDTGGDAVRFVTCASVALAYIASQEPHKPNVPCEHFCHLTGCALEGLEHLKL
jgi:hypothetical protein